MWRCPCRRHRCSHWLPTLGIGVCLQSLLLLCSQGGLLSLVLRLLLRHHLLLLRQCVLLLRMHHAWMRVAVLGLYRLR